MSARRTAAAALTATLALAGCSSGEDAPTRASRPADSAPASKELTRCPLSGLEPRDTAVLDRPAVAVKVENHPAAYPLSGLEKAEVVYEEPVEGGLTRFLAIYHCTDSGKVGSVRSSRTVDPAIMTPTTRILAAAGGNAIVRKSLRKAGIFLIDEQRAGGAMRRIDGGSISFEHTLFGDTAALRRLGKRRHPKPPPAGVLTFGDLERKDRATRARTVTIRFSGATTVVYRWSRAGWRRFEQGRPFKAASGKPITIDNVVVEEHRVDLSKKIVDVAGNPSLDIADVTGSGRAVLFRDGRAIRGRWVRRSVRAPVRFRTRSGDAMPLRTGTTWIELVPSDKGEVKGSFSYRKR